MSWNLTDAEQDALMEAVNDALRPFQEHRVVMTLPVEREDGTIIPPRPARAAGLQVRNDAPYGIKALERVYDRIIEKGSAVGGRW